MANLFPDAAEPCLHCWDESQCRVPRPGDKVYNDECAYCPKTSEHGAFGILVCMTCFGGYCPDHVAWHHGRTQHAMYTRVKKTREESPAAAQPPTDISQIGVEAPVAVESFIDCYACQQEHVPGMGVTFDSYAAITNAASPNVQDAVRVNQWANCVACPHTTATPFVQTASPRFGGSAGGIPPGGNERCEDCDHAANNWLCLSCGHVGCPRAEAGGRQHAIAHYEATGHPLVLKLGTVTPLGADVYCYACDLEALDPNLSAHVATYGINMATATKTAKSLGEQALDYTLAYDFNQVTEAGSKLEPVFGPDCTGLRNFGNTCYIASVLQILLATDAFRSRYVTDAIAHHQQSCTAQRPHDCFLCQMEKLAKGLWSGDFARSDVAPHLNGFAPRDFKRLVNHGHPEFSTAEQQDAAEYLRYFIEQLSRRDGVSKAAPSALQSRVYERKSCDQCGGCEYKMFTQSVFSLTVPVDPPPPLPRGEDGKPVKLTDEQLAQRRPRINLDQLLDFFLQPTNFSLTCSHCHRPATYYTTTRFQTFPELIAVHARREYFCRQTYQAKKLDVNIDVPDLLDLARLEGAGPQPGETIWRTFTEEEPRSHITNASAAGDDDGEHVVDEVALMQLISMDIPEAKARRALRATSNSVERAVDWVFSHDDDNEVAAASTTATAAPQQTTAATIVVGRPAAQARPVYRLIGLVSHVGSSAVTGHYVAHVRRRDGQWIFFNDEKVGLSQKPPKEFASIYLYERVVE